MINILDIDYRIEREYRLDMKWVTAKREWDGISLWSRYNQLEVVVIYNYYRLNPSTLIHLPKPLHIEELF